jgi:putative hydrolase of the HAD superfamily
MGDGTVSSSLSQLAQRVKAIVFDLDGTLYQNDRLGEEVNQCACRYIASLRGVSPAAADRMLQEARDCQSGPGKTLSLAVISLGGNLQDLHQRFATEIEPEGVLTMDERVPQLLRRLAGRFEIHLYTNNNRELSGKIMAQIGVAGMFGKVFTIEDSWRPKPDPVALQGILEAIGRKPCEALFVGDRYGVDLSLPEEMGCAVFEARTVAELLQLEQLLGDNG